MIRLGLTLFILLLPGGLVRANIDGPPAFEPICDSVVTAFVQQCIATCGTDTPAVIQYDLPPGADCRPACCSGGAGPSAAPASAPSPPPINPCVLRDLMGGLTLGMGEDLFGGEDDCAPSSEEEGISFPGVPSCDISENTSDWGSCEGAFGPWDTTTNMRRYEGTECRTITTTDSCGGQSTEEECRPCGYEQVDTVDPVCESVVDWSTRPLESVVLSCEDDLAGCDETTYENGERNVTRTEVLPARACDVAGNCVECPVTNPDTIAPVCTATFYQTGRWHRDDNFEINGGPVRCWLERCEDEGGAECLPIPILEDTPKEYEDVGGMIELVQVEQDPLIQAHRDTCTIQICDNAGNCSTCESPEIAYDGTNLCRSADQNCDSCGEDDVDCQCIAGDREKCTNSGPVNCYADPFHERCPGFENEACLSNSFIPGCPVFNPCYPETNRDHPRLEEPNCPTDAIRFCSRNPYHYGCNEACKFGLIECDPNVPEGGEK